MFRKFDRVEPEELNRRVAAADLPPTLGEAIDRFVRHVVCVGDVGEAVEAIRGDRQ